MYITPYLHRDFRGIREQLNAIKPCLIWVREKLQNQLQGQRLCPKRSSIELKGHN